MVELKARNPYLSFILEILAIVLIAAVLVWIFGLIQNWSLPVDYSNGFFLACVALAAISSSWAILKRPGIRQGDDIESAPVSKEQEYPNNLTRFLATRSLNFKMLVSALICLILSILIAQ